MVLTGNLRTEFGTMGGKRLGACWLRCHLCCLGPLWSVGSVFWLGWCGFAVGMGSDTSRRSIVSLCFFGLGMKT